MIRKIKVLETRGGVRCVHTGGNGTEVVKTERGRDYIRVQILPAVPQRFEWVAASNLREASNHG